MKKTIILFVVMMLTIKFSVMFTGYVYCATGRYNGEISPYNEAAMRVPD